MKVKNIRVSNYKSIEDSGVISLADNFTVIVGQNNAGKTALLERLSFSSQADKPHKNSKQHSLHILNPASVTEIDIEMSGEEGRWALLSTGQQAQIPVPPELMKTPINDLLPYIDKYLSQPKLKMSLIHNRGWHGTAASQHRSLAFTADAERRGFAVNGWVEISRTAESSIALPVINSLSFAFRAERLNVGTSPSQADLELRPNASNLAGALDALQGRKPALFNELKSLVKKVLPVVSDITTVPDRNDPKNQTIMVWNEQPPQSGAEVGYPLEDCGTGIGQVLALLFVVTTSPFGRLIVIDEPNSFLHPRAVRELVGILRSYSQHQYVVATHSAEVIAAIRPDTLILARWRDTKTEFEVQSGSGMVAARAALDEVGARLSDVFGYDSIVWVEGPTEAACFPKLLGTHGQQASAEIGFVPIVNVGDLEAKRHDAELTWRVYERLTNQSALMPQTIAFSLDREGRSQPQREELKRRSKGLVRFLPRRTYENYLIYPVALV